MDGIAFGCLTALACARWRLKRNVLRGCLLAGAVIAVFVLLMCNEDSHVGLARYGLNVTLLEGAVALMLLALGSGVGNRGLAAGTGWLRRIGRSSYEIYLLHMPVVLGLMNLFRELKPPTATIPLWYAGMLLPSLLLGYLLSRYYSEPLNQRLRRRDRSVREVPGASTARESG